MMPPPGWGRFDLRQLQRGAGWANDPAPPAYTD
jgi:hypothetical protein